MYMIDPVLFRALPTSMMLFLKEVIRLLQKEFLLEWKRKYAFNGLLLYVISMVVVVALAFVARITPLHWVILYWLIVLFGAINVIAKSFMGENPGQQFYLYTLASPEALLVAKIIYNTLLLSVIALLTFVLFSTLSGVAILNPARFVLILGIGCLAFSANLTLVSAISSKAENQSTLLAVLSFPLIVPVLLTLIKVSRSAIEGLDTSFANDDLFLLLGISGVLVAVSVILFPFVWRS